MKRLITLLVVAASLLAQAGDVTVKLPRMMLPGPLDPVCNDETGECPLLSVAWLGPFASIDELRASTFYPLLTDLYPALAEVSQVAVDTGGGSLWLIEPLFTEMSLAINEYDFDMFLGTRSEDDGAVLLRTEQARPIVVRMTAADPGQMRIHATDNEGHSLTWIPTLVPTTGELRYPDPDVVCTTMDVIIWRADLGRDYVCDLGGGHRATLRFYLDGQVAINGELGRYRAFHLDDRSEAMGLWLQDAHGRQTAARVTAFEGTDRAFNLEVVDGYDLGLGISFATFLPE
ncbi:MAG: hypothetical protein IKR25_13255 [Muribaculaceae bacterium]|nr:hypothetical protein [Muribaculaceae bacterium]